MSFTPRETASNSQVGLSSDGLLPWSDRESIAALASARGRGAIAVIRVSGDSCLSLLASCFANVQLSEVVDRRMTRVRLIDPTDHHTIDDCLISVFRGPRSFTGQDSLEVFCHGGGFVTNEILRVFQSCGVRLAEAGEFTRRAFLLGKVDLTAAEGIRQLAQAETRSQWVAGRSLAEGRLAETIERLRQRLIQSMALFEARIDFPDEGDTQGIPLQQAVEGVREAQGFIRELLGSYEAGRVASKGLRVVLVGPPNAGKSSLLNRLLQRERAIVTEVPGTTRDYLEEECFLAGRLFRLIDTAGIHKTDDPIEKAGIDRVSSLVRDADLVLALLPTDGNSDQGHELERQLEGWAPARVIYCQTKTDLNPVQVENGAIPISIFAPETIEGLRTRLVTLFDQTTQDAGRPERVFITEPRHVKALESADQCLDRFFSDCQEQVGDECLAFELQEAAEHLVSIMGVVSNDDILDRVFQQFCVGK